MIPTFPILPGGGAAAPAAITDPFFANVSLLLHFDGADASTTFTDSSSLANVFTANGNAQIDTAQSVFGGASGLFDGAGDWISTPAFAGVNLGSGDFTIEGRVRFANAAAANEFVMGNYSALGTNASATFAIYRDATGKLNATGFNGSSTAGHCISTTTLAANTWYAYRYVRSGSNFALYLGGASEAIASSGASLNVSTDTLSIGRPGAANASYMNGHVEETRITKGVARCTTNYTLDSAAFPDS